jgi:hypothetical protein
MDEAMAADVLRRMECEEQPPVEPTGIHDDRATDRHPFHNRLAQARYRELGWRIGKAPRA